MVEGEKAYDFLGYIALQGRSKVSILINSWHDIDDELKTDIWSDIKVFILYPIIFLQVYFCAVLITSLLCKHKITSLLLEMMTT